MRSWFDVLVVGGINTDYVVRGSSLPAAGGSVSDGEFLRTCGGKGLNQAVTAARLGARVALVAAIGDDDAGEEALSCLARERVAAQFARRRAAATTGVSVIQVDVRGRKQTAAALGANLLLSPEDIDAAADAIAHTRMLIVQLEILLPAVQRAIEVAAGRHVPVILDPAPARELPEALIALTLAITPNAGEAGALTGVAVHDRASAAAAAHVLRLRGATHVSVATDTGRLLVSESGERWYPNLPVDRIDTTGAGDAFAGALAVALVEEQPIADAVAFAHAAAALSTTRLGGLPSLPTRQELDAFMRSTYA